MMLHTGRSFVTINFKGGNNMTQEQKTDWKVILGVIAMAILYVIVQYKCTEIINTIPRF